MNTLLPTVEELERLSVRAVVAYAARTARRLSSELKGIVANDIMDNTLRLVEKVLTADPIGEGDKTLVIRAAECVAAAYHEAPASVKSPEKSLFVFSLVQVALAAMHGVLAAEDRSNARLHMNRAARCAQQAVRPIQALNGKAASKAAEAARQDYDLLLQEYGEHEEVVVGGLVRCFGPE